MTTLCHCFCTRQKDNGDIVNECWGTKECRDCKCNGYEILCDFYASKRIAARQGFILNNFPLFSGKVEKSALLEALVKREDSENERCPDWVFDTIARASIHH